MTPNQKRILIAVVLILFIAFLAWWFLRGRASSVQSGVPVNSTAPVNPGDTSTAPPPANPTPTTVPPAPPETPATIAERNVVRFSMQFGERYGSYSTETNNQNFRDLEPLMTAKMKADTEAMIAAKPAPTVFYGVTTRAIAGTSVPQTDGSTTVVVSTQREEVIGSSSPRVFQQELRLTLVKSGGEWLVDSAVWGQQ